MRVDIAGKTGHRVVNLPVLITFGHLSQLLLAGSLFERRSRCAHYTGNVAADKRGSAQYRHEFAETTAALAKVNRSEASAACVKTLSFAKAMRTPINVGVATRLVVLTRPPTGLCRLFIFFVSSMFYS
jgi:hypothetical protein